MHPSQAELQYSGVMSKLALALAITLAVTTGCAGQFQTLGGEPPGEAELAPTGPKYPSLLDSMTTGDKAFVVGVLVGITAVALKAYQPMRFTNFWGGGAPSEIEYERPDDP